jgi:hypothetical protein
MREFLHPFLNPYNLSTNTTPSVSSTDYILGHTVWSCDSPSWMDNGEIISMTQEERIAGLEQNVADLAEMVASLTWGRQGHGRSHHQLGGQVYCRASDQLRETKNKPPHQRGDGRKFR